jgi:hypothetical protein
LGEGGLEVFDDFGGDDIGIGKVGTVFEAFVFELYSNQESRRQRSVC